MKRYPAAALAILLLPPLVAAAGAARYHRDNRDTHFIESGGERRGFVLHVPDSYDAARPAPLILSFHGAGLWGAGQRTVTRLDALADSASVIVAYPSADDDGVNVWLPKDVRFVADLIDTLRARYRIDTTRIYANGLSNGGGLSFVLSCTMRGRIAAVGLVSSAQTVPWQWCPDKRPVPVIIFHGTADRMTPYHGGTSRIAPHPFPSIPQWASLWAERNGCGLSVDSIVATNVSRRSWVACGGNDVVFYTITGGGHTWPGGADMPEWLLGRTSTLNANRIMWEFFERHRMTDDR